MLIALPAEAARCGSALIVKGDSQAKVQKYCGEPATKSNYYAVRRGTYPTRNEDGDWVPPERDFKLIGRTEVLVEDWVYNFGPNKFMRKIRFTNGVVEDIETVGRGYREEKNKDSD